MSNHHGFTLIELLIVIAIIGILAAIGLNTFPRAQQQARDTQRKSDLKQYQVALEAYANSPVNNGNYPSVDGSGDDPATNLCASAVTDLDGKGFIASCPEDVKYSSDNSYQYRYNSDGPRDYGPTATKYVMYVKLEGTSDYWVVCSTGRSGTKAQSGFSVSGGSCPL